MESTAKRRERHRYDWPPEHLALLGTMSDRDVAERIGGKPEAVLAKRQALRIEAFKPKTSPVKGKARPNFDWNESNLKLLGTMTDAELGKKLGLANTTVAAKRRSLGIPGRNGRLEPIVIPRNFKLKLGKWSDGKIASKLGVASSAVSRARRKLGIPPIMKANYLPPEADEYLGKLPDTVIAERFGVSRTCVGNRRAALGIARTKVMKKAKRRPECSADAKKPRSKLEATAGTHF